MPLIPIPTRFENILASEALEPAPLLVRVEEDLQFFDRLRRYAEGQHAGVIAFPVGGSGSGKTTAVHSAAAFMPERFAGGHICTRHGPVARGSPLVRRKPTGP